MNLSSKTQNIIAYCTLVSMIAGGILYAEDRYVSEVEAAETMQQVQQSLQQMRIDMHKENQMIQYDFVSRQYYDACNRLEQNPTNPMVRAEVNRLEKRMHELGRALGIR